MGISHVRLIRGFIIFCQEHVWIDKLRCFMTVAQMFVTFATFSDYSHLCNGRWFYVSDRKNEKTALVHVQYLMLKGGSICVNTINRISALVQMGGFVMFLRVSKLCNGTRFLKQVTECCVVIGKSRIGYCCLKMERGIWMPGGPSQIWEDFSLRSYCVHVS